MPLPASAKLLKKMGGSHGREYLLTVGHTYEIPDGPLIG